ncbi:hypothetical protein B0T16DRAFT_397964 [Cercophora newfieldiana]|uniref:Uncharacterized protein n=1 Tax=Cercophora newfieldiana TaxID=92897 RepID=A0AA39YQD0_9PEZI|nr:hypothetical protein B0T16DRAFT_397964 [Cercophora newfieldiana]
MADAAALRVVHRDFPWLEWLTFRDNNTVTSDFNNCKQQVVRKDEFTAQLAAARTVLKVMRRLKRFAFVIRKLAAIKGGLFSGASDHREVREWYTEQVQDFGTDLPDLENICILTDWPVYYEGTGSARGERLTVVKKSAEDLDLAQWPVGLRD